MEQPDTVVTRRDATPVPAGAIESAVAALPGLPSAHPADRYGIRQLTAAWLAECGSPHTRTGYFRDLAAYLHWCQQHHLDPLTARATDLGQYRAALQDTGAPATAHRRLSAISSWYRYLVTNTDGAVTANPAAAVRRPRVDRDASTTAGLTIAEVRALLAQADTEVVRRTEALLDRATASRQARHLAALRDRALLRMLADLGLRIGEALALDVDALSHNRGRRTIRYIGKGGKPRERPLSWHTLEGLDEYLAARAAATDIDVTALTGPLLATTGRSGRPGRLDEPAAFRLIRRLAKDSGLPSAGRLSPHSLRHAFATNARELGVPIEDVQDAMGHADTRTTRRYDRARHALHRDPALKLADHYGG
jgi:site-specific recombinase XerD